MIETKSVLSMWLSVLRIVTLISQGAFNQNKQLIIYHQGKINMILLNIYKLFYLYDEF